MEENKIVIQKNHIFKMINQSGLMINRLARFLDVFAEPSMDTPMQHDQIEDVDLQTLPSYLLEPYNISFLSVVTSKDDMVFTTVLSDENHYGFYSYLKESELLTLKTMMPQEIINLSKDLIGTGNAIASGTKLFFTPLGLLTLVTLVDLVRRDRLENLILHLVGESKITVSKMEEIFELSINSGDIRWLTPFVLEILNPLEMMATQKIDMAQGLRELETMGLLWLEEDVLQLTDQGREFLDLLVEPSGWMGIKSLYYYDQELQLLPTLFISIHHHLYYIMPIDGGLQYSWVSIDLDTFEETLEMTIAPGEIPYEKPIEIPIEILSDEPVEIAIVAPGPDNIMKFCIYCGTALKKDSRFCVQCGKPVASK